VKLSPFIRFGLVGALLSLSPLTLHFATAAPDNTLGMALMSATVDAATPPNLVRGSGVVSLNRIGSNAVVDVEFNRDLSNCTCTASVGWYATDASLTGGPIAGANCPFGSPNKVRVTTVAAGGSSGAIVPFHLIVFCPK
jgi:hypothetical protein